jgi:circadian clock protein KaiC
MSEGIEKIPTGIPGFDHMAYGGLPKGRVTLVTGTAGSGKTILATQYLAQGIEDHGENGVFVSFEESAPDILSNVHGFGWDIDGWIEDDRWAFIDASLSPDDETIISGQFDFDALIARVEHAITRIGAKRVSIDSIAALFLQFEDATVVRRELLRLAFALKQLGVTTVVTSERNDDYGRLSRFGVEEYVADNVVILRHVLHKEKRRRTIELFKIRGTNHQRGEVPFTISGASGIVVLPLSAMELKQSSSNVRITSGSAELDDMCSGGFFRDSIVLVSGATGTGKTLLTTEFVASVAGSESRDRALLFAFEESRDQLIRNADSWGKDYQALEEAGQLRLVCRYPETIAIEDILLSMRREIDEFRPDRVAIDSLSALERVASARAFREFLLSITALLKQREITGLFTSTTPGLMGGSSVTDSRISTITDSIILLRYVETGGQVRRGLTVLKMRGSSHDKNIREFTIDGEGLAIIEPFDDIEGILAGDARLSDDE